MSVDDAYVDDVSVDSASSSQDGSMMMVANVASKIVALSGLGLKAYENVDKNKR